MPQTLIEFLQHELPEILAYGPEVTVAVTRPREEPHHVCVTAWFDDHSSFTRRFAWHEDCESGLLPYTGENMIAISCRRCGVIADVVPASEPEAADLAQQTALCPDCLEQLEDRDLM